MKIQTYAIAALSAAASVVSAADLPISRTSPVVVTATRFEEPLGDKPVNMSVITSEDIRASTAKTVPDLLAEQAGITIHDFFGNNASTTTVDMRGFGVTGAQNTLILVDGRRVTDIDLSGVQWSATPLSAIERIEIVRGGGAVLYGEGATAGVINIITKSPFRADPHLTLRGMRGSYDTTEGVIEGSYFGSAAGISVYGGNFVSDGYRRNNKNRQSNALADVRVLTGLGDIALKVSNDNQGIRLPGGRTVQPSIGLNQLESDRRGTSTPRNYAQREGDRVLLDWHSRTSFGEFNIGGGWRDKEQRAFFDFPGFPTYRENDLDVLSFTPRVKITTPLWGHANTLIAGLDWYRWRYGLRQSNSSINIVQPINSVDARQETLGGYLLMTTQLSERVTTSVGARRERLHIEATDRFDPTAPGGAFGAGAPPGSQRETQHAYELALRYQWLPMTALIAKTSRSYRFANVDEIYEFSPTTFGPEFQFLRPQTAHTHELDIETRVAGADLRGSLFMIDVRNEIHLDLFTTGIGNTNLPPSRRRGLELEAKRAVLGNATLGASYTYTDAKFREGVLPGSAFAGQNIVIAGKTVPLVPRHKLNVSASWALTSDVRLNTLVTYVGSQYMDNDESNTLGTKIPAYAVVDMKLAYTRGPWRVAATVNNLFNEKYFNYAVRSVSVLTPDRYDAYPLPERNVNLLLEYTFR